MNKPLIPLISLAVFLSLLHIVCSLDQNVNVSHLNDTIVSGCPGMKDNAPKHKVELYITSTVESEFLTSVKSVIAKIGPSMNLSIDFIGSYSETKNVLQFSSTKGPSEVDGDKWMLCGISTLRENYKYMDFIECISATRASESPNVDPCLRIVKDQEGVDKSDEIKYCHQNGKADRLLKQSMDVSNNKGVGASPTLIYDGNVYSGRFDQNAKLSEAICNPPDHVDVIGSLEDKLYIVIFVCMCVIVLIFLFVVAAYTIFYKYWKAAPDRWLNMLKTRRVSDSLQFSQIQVDDSSDGSEEERETGTRLLDEGA